MPVHGSEMEFRKDVLTVVTPIFNYFIVRDNFANFPDFPKFSKLQSDSSMTAPPTCASPQQPASPRTACRWRQVERSTARCTLTTPPPCT